MKKKQVIVIAGGSGGIGVAIAKLLADDHQLIILGRNLNRLEQVKQSLAVETLEADLTDYVALTKVINQILAKYGQIDVAINCVGVLLDGSLDQLTADDIKQLFDVNVLGAVYFSKAVLPRMKELNSGKIIHLASQASLVARKYRSVYNASKWALRGFGLSLQEEVAKYQISVSLIHPGIVNTEFLKKAGVDPEPDRGLSPDQVAMCVKLVVEAEQGLVVTELGVRSLRDY